MSLSQNISIIKIGGSVIFSEALPTWMDAICATSQPIILVTGGGKYADLIRAMQRDWGLRKKAAHDMALVTMDQTAALIADDYEKCAVAHSEEEIQTCLEKNTIPIWAPYQATKEAEDIEPGWKVTSDSLTLWFANKMNATQTFLIKSKPLEETSHNANSLSKDGVVDEAFSSFLKKTTIPCNLLCPGDWKHLDEYLSGSRSRTITLAP